MKVIHENIVRSKYSQINQDIWVLKETNFKKNGYFVDFGAADGVVLSNSYLLEKEYEWSGIVCEPNKTFHENILKTRNCTIDFRCVYQKSGHKIKFLDVINSPELSSLEEYAYSGDEFSEVRRNNNSYYVESISLNDLLKEHNAPVNIDYINIDTEGSEYDILKYFDFSKYNVHMFTIEHNWMPPREKIYSLLTSNGYQRVHEHYSRWDDWYIKI